MKKMYQTVQKLLVMFALVIIGFSGASAVHASGTLSNVSITADTYLQSATSTYTISFTTATDVTGPNYILYTFFPSGFDLSGASLSTASLTINGSPAAINTGAGWINASGNSVMIKAAADVPAGSNVSIQLPGIVNPAGAADYNFTWLRTSDTGGNAIDDTPGPVTVSVMEPLVPFDGGDGSSAHPYLISTCTQLQAMKQHLSAEYQLTQDVDCSETATWNANVDEWQGGVVGGTLIPDPYPTTTHTSITINNNGYFGFKPVGDAGHPFTGVLHGNGKKIKNLWIFRKTSENNGLFGVMTGATIEQLTLENASIVGGNATGAFAGVASGGSINHVTSSGSMVRAYLAYYGGGIVGNLVDDGIIDYATVTGGTVHGSGNIIGGLIGYMQSGTLSHSSSSANVDGGYDIGGAIGHMDNGTVSDTVVTGTATSNRSEYVVVKTGYNAGGFVGYMSSGTITNSHATGNVSSSGYYAGGFVGMIMGTNVVISNSYATGDVNGVVENFDSLTFTPAYVGGFAGFINGNTQITDAYATGDVVNPGDYTGGFVGMSQCGPFYNRVYATGSIHGANTVGGFAGFDGCEGPSSTLSQVYATGDVAASGNEVGGLIGHAEGTTVNDAYARGSVTGNDLVGGLVGLGRFGGISHAYATGLVTGVSNQGGIFGVNDPTFPVTATNLFFDKTTTGMSDDHGGQATDTAIMKTSSLYTEAGWDFSTIWNRTNGTNDGYPMFKWQTGAPADITAPVLTLVHPLTGVIPASEARFAFRSDELCDVQATPLSVDDGRQTEVLVEEVALNKDIHATVNPLNPGTTYSFSISCVDSSNNVSNSLQVGPFTVEQTGGSTGAGTPWTPVTKSDAKTTCDASQLLTQNLRAPARNGSYSPYTKAIVTEVKILQGHMNRLGFNAGPIDGILGKLTDGAIKRMQKYLRTPADGLVGPKTRALINNSCGSNHL